MISEQVTSSRQENLWFTCTKRGTRSTLHEVTKSVKNGIARKMLSSNRYQRLATVPPTTTFV